MTKAEKIVKTPRSTPAACSQGADLWAYLDGELPPARARATARHVRTCAECTARARRLRAMLDECRVTGCKKLPADVRARASARARELIRRGRLK